MSLVSIALSAHFFWLMIMWLSFGACGSALFASEALQMRSLNIEGLENFYQYSERVYGGSGPYTANNFAELKRLGIGMVISVDGATPKVELAEAQGLRYVHIPIGYDAVPHAAQLQLVKAYQEAGDSIYVHCHHGEHRGPAAIGSMLVGLGLMTSDEAVMALRQAGTSEGYQGLYRDVETARVLSPDELEDSAPLVSVAVVSDFTHTMAAIDVHWDHLKLIRKASWVATEEHPDIDPKHEALLLNEHFQELVRQEKEVDYSEEEAVLLKEFRLYLKNAANQSAELESGLRLGVDGEYLELKFQALKQSCVSCHETYRNSSNVEHRTLKIE